MTASISINRRILFLPPPFCLPDPIRRALQRFALKSSAATRLNRTEVNDRAAVLLDTYGNSILRLAFSYLHSESDAEEVLQDTLIKFLEAAPALESPAHEKAWLLRVAANLSKNRIDYNRVRQADDLDALEETLAAEQREDLSFVWDAVKSLPVPYREVIHLYYQEDCSTAQIAAVLNENEATIRSRLKRGREKLKIILKEVYDFGDEI